MFRALLILAAIAGALLILAVGGCFVVVRWKENQWCDRATVAAAPTIDWLAAYHDEHGHYPEDADHVAYLGPAPAPLNFPKSIGTWWYSRLDPDRYILAAEIWQGGAFSSWVGVHDSTNRYERLASRKHTDYGNWVGVGDTGFWSLHPEAIFPSKPSSAPSDVDGE